MAEKVSCCGCKKPIGEDEEFLYSLPYAAHSWCYGKANAAMAKAGKPRRLWIGGLAGELKGLFGRRGRHRGPIR